MSEHTVLPWVVGPYSLSVESGEMKICDIRGWGYLTGSGHGALGLPEKEAVAIQEANASFIVDACNSYYAHKDAIRELVDALKDIHPLIEHDAPRYRIGKIIMKYSETNGKEGVPIQSGEEAHDTRSNTPNREASE